MSDYRTIEIDLDVHRQIEGARVNFSQTPNEILRELLGLAKATKPNGGAKHHRDVGNRPWSGKGVTLPHGTELRMEYNGRVHEGVIEDGKWRVEGALYESPSAAAGSVARTKSGKTTSLDGWIYWQAKRPGEPDWVGIASMRRQ
jgi:hypothetical protein